MNKRKNKVFGIASIMLFTAALISYAQNPLEIQKKYNDNSFPITINYNNLQFKVLVKESSVKDILESLNIQTNSQDIIIPSKETIITPGSQIFITRAIPVNLIVDGKSKQIYTTARRVEEIINEANIVLKENDRVEPFLQSFAVSNIVIKIIRVSEKTVTEKISIPFKKIIRKDENLSWGENKIIQKGKQGEKEQIFKITYENGKEISRKLINEKILTKPQDQIEVQGTKITIGKIQTGTATWYAKGLRNPQKLTAASNTFPKGTYLKVTNFKNNKCVIVKVNDIGAFRPPIIIDLSSGAFKKLAPLSRGKIDVRVEEII